MVSSLKFISMNDENSVGEKRCILYFKNNVGFFSFFNGKKIKDIFNLSL